MTQLIPSGRRLPARPPDDFEHLRTVVEVGYPVRQARTFLRRNLGNRVHFHLVEADRGETLGSIRAVQINPANQGEPVILRRVRLLPDGSEASAYIPDEMVEFGVVMESADGQLPTRLEPGDEILLHVPVRSYLRFLPGTFRGAVPAERRNVVQADEASMRRWGHQDQVDTERVQHGDTDAMRRLLFIFQHQMTGVIDKVADIPSLTDPMTCDPQFLSWLASWVGFTLDESLPLHQQRELTRRAIRLYRTRGTQGGMEEMIRVLTTAPVSISAREKPQPFVLGAATLAGGGDPGTRYQNGEPPPHYLYRPERGSTNFFAVVLERRDRFDERFSERAPAVLKRIAQVVTQEKPAHVTFTIRFDER